MSTIQSATPDISPGTSLRGPTGPQAQTPAPAPEITFDEAPYSANVRVIDTDGFEWQCTIRAQTFKGIVARSDEMRGMFARDKYTPARAASGSNGSGVSPVQPAARATPRSPRSGPRPRRNSAPTPPGARSTRSS